MVGLREAEKKLTFGELLFAPFAWIRLGWYLQTISVFEELEKIKPEKELEQDFSIFFSDRWKWAVWYSEQRTNTAEWLVQWPGLRLSAASDHLRLGFGFYTEKSSTPSVLAVLVLCLRSLAFVTVSARPPRVCQIWLTRYGTCVQEPSTSETAADAQLSIARLSNLTKRPGSLPGGWRHTETLAIVGRPRRSKSVPFFFSEIPASDSARPSQVADTRRF